MPFPILGAISAGAGLLGGLFDNGPDRPRDRNLAGEIGGVMGLIPGLADSAYDTTARDLPRYTQLELGRDTAVRGGAVSDAARYAPTLARIRRDANPASAGLLDQLIALARSRLGAGGALSPEELRTSQQEARAAWSARGLGRSPAAGVEEILNSDALRRTRLNEAQALGLNTAGLASSIEGNPAAQVLGIPTQGYGQAAYANADPTRLLGYSSDLYNTNYNAAASASNADANNRAGLYGALIRAGGSILGAGAG